MNDEMEQFEKLLKRQPLQHVPAEWRKEILAAANGARTGRAQTAVGESFFSVLNRRLASLLWPHPVAWGALAAVWIFILGANLSMRDPLPVMAKKVSPPSPEVVAELRQQHQLLAELLGANEAPAADRPKVFVPGPRSERVEILTA